MTATTPPPPPPAQVPPPSTGQRMPPAGQTALIVGLSLIAVVTVLGVVLATMLLRGGSLAGSFNSTRSVEAGTSVVANIPNAAVELRPGTDDQVHVETRGTYFGSMPTLKVTTSGGVTSVSGGCPSQWFGFCSVNLTVTLPASLPVVVRAQNGRVTATGLTGPLKLASTNGQITTTGTRGEIELRTTNGSIRVGDAASRRVTAETTNGSIELEFLDAPTAVDARSTNGNVTVRVPPDGVTYSVDVRTTNGKIENESVPSDPSSRRSITAATTNGNVTITAR
jgi:hypothetical protein